MVLWRGREGSRCVFWWFQGRTQWKFSEKDPGGSQERTWWVSGKSRLVSGRTQVGIRKDSGGCQKNPMDLRYYMSSRAFGPGLSLWPAMTKSWKALGLELL